jgi:hypothetical protein
MTAQEVTGDIEIVVDNTHCFNFGIGCLHFAPSKFFPDRVPANRYSFELKRVLERIPSITELSISPSYSIDESEFITANSFARLSDGFYESNLFDEIFFYLSIPEHFIEHEGAWIGGIIPQTISVHIKSGFYAPVAVIGYYSSQMEEDGARYVVAAREYLKFALQNTRDCPFELDFVGPSPMHMNFSILAVDNESAPKGNNFNKVIEKQAGYDWMKITVYPDEYNDNASSVGSMVEKFLHDADIFYFIALQRSRLLDMYHETRSNVTAMVDSAEPANSNKSLPISRKRSHLIRQAFVNTVNLQIEESSVKFEIRTQIASSKEKGNILAEVLDSRLESFEKFPTEEFSKLIEFFESKDQHIGEITLASISTVIGAVIGSIITYLLST